MQKLTYPLTLLLLTVAAATQAGSPAAPAVQAEFAGRATRILADVDTSGPGVALLVMKGDVVLLRTARGSADIELSHPLTADSAFRIGSVTKTFTAATILRLAQSNRLAVEDPLSRYLPDFSNAANIRLSQLLDHTAGISDAWDPGEKRSFTTGELVKLISAQPADFQPGEDWRYSNSGYMLLGAVIEKVTGTPWFAAIHAQVAAPLHLPHTNFFDDSALVPEAAEGYTRGEGGQVMHPAFASITGPSAAGALTSTVDDLALFVRALSQGRLLNPELTRAMTTPKSTAAGQEIPYGYGVMMATIRGEPVIEHNGGLEGFASQLTYFPRQDVTVVVLSNTDSAPPSPRTLSRKLGALAMGSPYPEFKTIEPPPSQLKSLLGEYRIDAGSKRTLALADGLLTARRDNGPARRLLVSDDGLLFFEGDGLDYFSVARDAQGKVSALEFHADGMGITRSETRVQP